MKLFEQARLTGKMGLQDLLIGPAYYFFVLSTVLFLAIIFLKNKDNLRIFLMGFLLKVIGILLFSNLYQFYYGYGDTFRFYKQANRLSEVFWKNPFEYFAIIFHDYSYIRNNLPYLSYALEAGRDTGSFTVIKFASLLMPLGLYSYINVALLFGLFTFFAQWLLYFKLRAKYPHVNAYALAAPFFFIPSVFFWSSGIMKDGLSMGFLSLAILGFINIFDSKSNTFWNSLLFALSFILLYKVKSYIALALLVGIFCYLFIQSIQFLRQTRGSTFTLPILNFSLISILLVGFALFRGTINSVISGKLREIENMANYLFRISADKGGSVYSIGTVDYSFPKVLLAIPKSLNVTFFRPYLWEAKNIVSLITSVESLITLLLTIILLFYARFNFKLVFRDPLIALAIGFIMTLGTIIGISSGNFGTLVRYKLPLIPLYWVVLVLMVHFRKSKDRKKIIN